MNVPDNDITHQGNAHNAAVLTAQAAKQVAYKAAGNNQASVKQADIAFHRAVIVSAKANGVGFGVNVQALYELGQNGQ